MAAVRGISPPNGKVRVLNIIGTLGLGGAEARVVRLSQAVRDHGVDTEVCALQAEGPNLASLIDAGIPVHGTPYLKRPFRSNTVMLMRTIDTIRKIIKAGRFDIVHTNLFWSDVLGVPAARLGGCRRIIVSRVALHSWVHAQTAFFHGLEQTSNILANELIADCNAVLKDAERHERLLPSKRCVIYSGIDVASYRAARPRPDGPLRILVLGALAPRKGQEYAIEALALLKQSGVEAVLQLVGSGPDEAMLRERVAEAGLNGAVAFAGAHPDPRPYLTNADLFLLPSRQEGGAIAMLEAMASSLPAIGTNVGAIPEALVDGQGGRLVPPGDSAAIAAAIAELARDRTKLAAMGQFNRERVAKLFSLERSARQLAAWYINGPGSLPS